MIKEITDSDYISSDINLLYIQAVRNNSIPQVRWCLENGADSKHAELMALDTAVTFKHFNMLKFLVTDIRLDPRLNRHCLIQAAGHNDVAMLDFLIEDCGCPPSHIDNKPIANAVFHNSFEAFTYLKDKGVVLTETEITAGNVSTYNASKLANLAWVVNSTKCLEYLLPLNKKLFFSEANIKYLLNAKKAIGKLNSNPELVNLVFYELLKYSPKKFDLFVKTKDGMWNSIRHWL